MSAKTAGGVSQELLSCLNILLSLVSHPQRVPLVPQLLRLSLSLPVSKVSVISMYDPLEVVIFTAGL